MEKIVDKQSSIRKGYIAAILIAACLSFAGSCIIGITFNYIEDALVRDDVKQYTPIEEKLYNKDGSFVISYMRSNQSKDERKLYNLLAVTQIFAVICWCAFSFILISNRFYKKRIKEPLNKLKDASIQITNSNLDFKVSPLRRDEFGQLSNSFEKMRASLQENNLEMWRQIEERKRLNTAFAHDLRTPLTVLKGQTEMIIKFVPDGIMTNEKICVTAQTMKTHITRLENYIETMSNLLRLEDIEINRKSVDSDSIISQLKSSGKLICENHKFCMEASKLVQDTVMLDFAVVIQVYENLLSNATRYAKQRVSVKISHNNVFSITVKDDGDGFSQQDLSEATKPFYRSQSTNSSNHFGMGLNICKILCEKHGGFLKLYNENGAVVQATFK